MASIVLGVLVGILGIATIILVVIIILMKRNSTSGKCLNALQRAKPKRAGMQRTLKGVYCNEQLFL